MQFLRFATLIILVALGFGTGICGLFAIGGMAIDTMQRSSGMDPWAPAAFVIGGVCILVAIACFFGVRALARSLRTHATPAIAPPAVPPAPPGPPPAA